MLPRNKKVIRLRQGYDATSRWQRTSEETKVGPFYFDY